VAIERGTLDDGEQQLEVGLVDDCWLQGKRARRIALVATVMWEVGLLDNRRPEEAAVAGRGGAHGHKALNGAFYYSNQACGSL